MILSNFDQMKRLSVRIFIAIGVIIAYVTIAVYFVYSQFMPAQDLLALAQSRVHVSVDTISSGHFIGEIQQTPSGVSFRWVDRRVPVEIPRFLNYGSIITFTTWLHPAANPPGDGPYDIVSVDKRVFTTQSNVFEPRTYKILSLPTRYTGADMYLFVPYVFTSDTPYWAYSGVTAEKIGITSFGIATYELLFLLLMLVIPLVYGGICWYATKHVRFSLAVGLVVATILAIRSQTMYEGYDAIVLKGILSHRIMMAVIIAMIVVVIITLYHLLSPFWQNIKRVLYTYVPVVHTRWFVVTAIILTTLWCVVVFNVYYVDWVAHEWFALRMQNNEAMISYFLYHITIVAIHHISLGLLSLKFASILLVFFIILLLCVMVWNMSASILPNPIFLAGATTLFLIFAPIPLLFMTDGFLYFGYFAANVYHNPTVLMLKPFALMHLLLLLHFFTEEPSDNDVVLWRVFWGVTLLTLLAKASYMIVMLPALGLFVGLRLIRRHPQWRRDMVISIVMVSATILPLIIQYVAIYDVGDRGMGIKDFSSIIANSCNVQNGPLWSCVLSLYGSLIIKLIGSVAFILSLWLVVPNIIQKIEIQLLGIATVIGLVYSFVLCEGEGCLARYSYAWFWGNFGWSVQICLFLLLFVGIRHLAIATVQQKDNRPWYFVVPYIIAGAHIVSGFFWIHRNIVNLLAW